MTPEYLYDWWSAVRIRASYLGMGTWRMGFHFWRE